MLPQAGKFRTAGKPLSCEPYGNGHINRTYRLRDDVGGDYILQKINRVVFRDPAALMKNIGLVTDHLRKSAASRREALTLVRTEEGEDCLLDDEGEYWRMYEFISDSICLERAETPADFRESAVAFGRFQRQLADFPAHLLTETIPRFHDTVDRYRLFQEAVQADVSGRAAAVKREIEFAMERQEFSFLLMGAQASGELPLRVTHNDTKLNNVLLDRTTRKALCVIDLDTVMPGLSVHDFGDSIRFGASTAPEDERDLQKVSLSLELFETYTAGFLSACGESLTAGERQHLVSGAKMMTLECGVRFLTDYLAGDVYFHTRYPEQNLDRCRTQFKLVAEMERKWDAMEQIVRRALGEMSR